MAFVGTGDKVRSALAGIENLSTVESELKTDSLVYHRDEDADKIVASSGLFEKNLLPLRGRSQI